MTVSDNLTGLKNYLRLMLGTVTDALIQAGCQKDPSLQCATSVNHQPKTVPWKLVKVKHTSKFPERWA